MRELFNTEEIKEQLSLSGFPMTAQYTVALIGFA